MIPFRTNYYSDIKVARFRTAGKIEVHFDADVLGSFPLNL